MSNETILLFLHGVGRVDRHDKWRLRLAESLVRIGYPDLDGVKLIAPKYAHALKGWDEEVPLPPVTIKPLPRDAAKKNRRDFERRMGAIEFRLGRHDRGAGMGAFEAAVDLGVELPGFGQARNYLRSRQIRAQVLSLILDRLPEAGRIVIVGHSLGSVIAADLVSRLPAGLEVAGMVTIGSPLANGRFDVDKLRDVLKEPPTNLAWWVNVWNAPDLVAAHRGVSSVFPWMIDFRIDTKKFGIPAHAAGEYLANDAVAAAIGFATFGSKSQELATIDKGLDIPLDTTEVWALLALRYAYLISLGLDGDTGDRFAGALRQVQANVIVDIRARNTRGHRAIPSAVARLAFDLSDPDAVAPVPLPVGHISKENAAVLLTVLATENIISPFEISVPKNTRQAAMENLTREMELSNQYGRDVFAAAKRAQDALSGDRRVNFAKLGALGLGAAALAVAAGGLGLAAAAGLAGGAAITRALAAFGPGGMIGGLLTAGTLVTADGGGIADSLASPGITAETLEAIIERRLAAAILRQLQHLEPDPAMWQVLVETEMQVRRDYERLDEFSDPSAPALKELKRKIDTIERALKHLKDNGLEPSAPADAADEED